MNTIVNRVKNLLTYIEAVEKLKHKPDYRIPDEFFAMHEAEFTALPGVQSNPGDVEDDVWLRVSRLQETTPPPPDEILKPWLVLSKSIDKPPVLRESLLVMEGSEQAGEELLREHPEVSALFEVYLQQSLAWCEEEKPRRKTISLYNKLFLLQQKLASEGAENPLELVWGVGVAQWKRATGPRVEHPLLTKLCEVHLDPRSFELSVRPRQAAPKLELDCYAEMELAGVPALETMWREVQSTAAQDFTPFSSATFEGMLRAAVSLLDPQGVYQPSSDRRLPTAGEALCVSDTWAVFARKRSQDVFLEDVRRLKVAVQAEGVDLPGVIKSFVEEGDSQLRAQPEVTFRGLSSSAVGDGVRELFFPLPYNEEQVAIVRKLEHNDGVVVQGPPGTGKTHTIANVICHYLAQGKRVLVTSKGETALSVLQQKLPERVSPLSVALLSDEREGLRQFEHSIQAIATQVATLQPDRLQANIEAFESELHGLHARLASLDHDIAAAARQHMQHYVFQGREQSPEELARWTLAQMEAHHWFDDHLPADASEVPPLSEEDVAELRQAREKARSDLANVGLVLPPAAQLPDWNTLATLHADLVRARTIEAHVQSGALHALRDASFETFEAASGLLEFLQTHRALAERVSAADGGIALRDRLRGLRSDDPSLTALMALSREILALEARRKALLVHAVDLPEGAEKHEDFLGALGRLLEGKGAFMLPFGKGEARRLVAAVTVTGSAPTSVEQWQLVQQQLNWRRDAAKEVARYGALAVEFDLSLPEGTLEASFRLACSQLALVEATHTLVFDHERQLFGNIEQVFGPEVADGVDNLPEALASVMDSLHAHLDKGRLSHALSRVSEFVKQLERCEGDLAARLRHFLQLRLGESAEEVAELKADWLALGDEATRLNHLQPWLELIAHDCERLARAGAVNWARRLKTEPPGETSDALLPTDWAQAWAWRVAVGVVERLDAHEGLRALFEQRRDLTQRLARTYEEVVAERTWLGVYNNSTDRVRQALQDFLTWVEKMGSGNGIRTPRYRRHAREAMKEAYQAVPCWVLPHWRVSEALPPVPGLFDLVVIDEASQSDIWALPALLRGKKLLVVGDHKQVSPSAVGLREKDILELVRRFLTEQPHGKHMTPDQSIYDLARVVFAGNSVMLKEHFRCVPAIIEYSNREFYEGQIRPLRVPMAHERLDPPLIDVFVKGGYRRGDKNPPEAQAIVDEIQSIIDDPACAGRSIGVVTLLGTEQGKLIHELVNAQIAPEHIVARDIAIGSPPHFQGRERDIMLVSMVLAQGDRTASNVLGQQQRFNVALSRARDRTYLFRSVQAEAFSPDSLTGRLLRHFRQPFAQDALALAAGRDRCESGFEIEVYDELTRRGYRVQPQVPCGGYRIDLVVEGARGRRLAIECDGDRFHGPGQWNDDMARQRTLERAGWTFWRCFASSFVRRREQIVADLLTTLDGLGIEPLGTEDVDSSAWVAQKTVDPLEETLF